MRPQHFTRLGVMTRVGRQAVPYGIVIGSIIVLLLTTLKTLRAQEQYFISWWASGISMQSRGTGYSLIGAVTQGHNELQGDAYNMDNTLRMVVTPTPTMTPIAQPTLSQLPTTTPQPTPKPGEETQTQVLFLPLIAAETP